MVTAMGQEKNEASDTELERDVTGIQESPNDSGCHVDDRDAR
jgi:hypothetical protein